MRSTPKRLRATFKTPAGAVLFSESKKREGAKDVVVVPQFNAEDKARGYTFPRFERADVIWTEDTTD